MDTLLDLLQRPDFRWGVILGLGGAVLVVLTSAIRWRYRIDPGLAMAGAFVLGLVPVTGRRVWMVVGIGLLAVAGLAWKRMPVLAAGGAIAGAVLVMYRSSIQGPAWVRIGGVIAILVIAAGIALYERDPDNPSPILLAGVTVFGVWADVPETQVPRLLLGIWLGVFPASLMAGNHALGRAGGPAFAAVIVWAAAEGGTMRLGSIPGGWATAGVFLLALTMSIPRRTGVVVAVHSVLVFMAARVAGFRESPVEAALIAMAGLIAGGMALSFVPRYEQGVDASFDADY